MGGRPDSGISGDRTQPSQGGTDYWLVKAAPSSNSLYVPRKAITAEEPAAKTELSSLTAYPNPLQEQVTINFTLPQTQKATLTIFDIQGRVVATLFQGEAQANQVYQLKWQAANKRTDIYLLQLQTPTKHQQKKLLLVK